MENISHFLKVSAASLFTCRKTILTVIIAKMVIMHRDKVLGRWEVAWNSPGKICSDGADNNTHAAQGALEVLLACRMTGTPLTKRMDGWPFGLVQQCGCTRICIKKNILPVVGIP